MEQQSEVFRLTQELFEAKQIISEKNQLLAEAQQHVIDLTKRQSKRHSILLELKETLELVDAQKAQISKMKKEIVILKEGICKAKQTAEHRVSVLRELIKTMSAEIVEVLQTIAPESSEEMLESKPQLCVESVAKVLPKLENITANIKASENFKRLRKSSQYRQNWSLVESDEEQDSDDCFELLHQKRKVRKLADNSLPVPVFSKPSPTTVCEHQSRKYSVAKAQAGVKYSCQKCDKQFLGCYNLKKHLDKVHNAVQTFFTRKTKYETLAGLQRQPVVEAFQSTVLGLKYNQNTSP